MGQVLRNSLILSGSLWGTLLSTLGLAINYESSVFLSWESVPGATAYIAQVRDKTRVVVEVKVKETQLTFDNVKPGKYSFRIRSIDLSGRISRWSQPSPIIVKPGPPLPQHDRKEVQIRGDQAFKKLRWEEISGIDSYRIRVMKNGKIVFEKDVNGNSVKIPLKGPGDYQYLLAARASAVLGEFGEPQEFKVRSKSAPSKIRLISPKNMAILKKSDVRIRWKPDSEATRYKVQLYKKMPKPQKAKKLRDVWVESTEISEELTAGEYVVRVVGADSLGIGNKGGVSRFRVQTQKRSASRFQLNPGFGVTLLEYRETTATLYSSVSLTAKVSVRYKISSRWSLGANTYFTAASLSRDKLGRVLRFLGVNGRVGYRLPFVPSPWSLSIMVGVYYTTTFTSDNSIGFKNMFGPQFFPVLVRSFKNKNRVYVYFKFSPIITDQQGLTPPTFKSRELAFGGGYRFQAENFPLTVSVDLAHLSVNFLDALKIDSRSLTMGIGITF